MKDDSNPIYQLKSWLVDQNGNIYDKMRPTPSLLYFRVILEVKINIIFVADRKFQIFMRIERRLGDF